jgi:hypothetical protein
MIPYSSMLRSFPMLIDLGSSRGDSFGGGSSGVDGSGDQGFIDADDSLDLMAAALEDDDPVLEKSRLVSRGFVHGRTVRWVGNNGALVASVTVHELASPTEALLSLADLREQLRAAAISGLATTEDSLCARSDGVETEPALAYAAAVSANIQVTVVLAIEASLSVDSRELCQSILTAQMIKMCDV